MDEKTYVAELVARAHKAQAEFETYSQERVDEVVRAIGKVVFDHGEELAQIAVEETGMGIVADKTVKNRNKAKAVWYKMKGVKSRGILRYIEEEGLVEVAKPVGVVGSICPVTNPNMTPMHNAMIALKGGNAIIVSPHPHGKKSGVLTCDYMREALKAVNAPIDLIQCVCEPTIGISQEIMAQCDMCLSTGGGSVVRAAYSSGKPAYGVGSGNVQVLIDRDADLEKAVPLIVKGRTYDNGILCTCEQAAICPKDKETAVLDLMAKENVYYTSSEEEREAFRHTIFPNGKIDAGIVGKTAVQVAALAGVKVPENTRMILIKLTETGETEQLSKEKLLPVMAFYTYDTWEEAVCIAKENLLNMGAGHSVVIHSNTKANIEYAAECLPVSRFSVNQQGSSSLGGAFINGLNPTGTIGCGSWGNNSTTDNLFWRNLVNISRISYIISGKEVPTDEEVWG